jgi:hypothetical protein
MKYPKIYYQTVALRKFWLKSASPDAPMMIQIFDETLETIKEQYPQFIVDDIEELDDAC